MRKRLTTTNILKPSVCVAVHIKWAATDPSCHGLQPLTWEGGGATAGHTPEDISNLERTHDGRESHHPGRWEAGRKKETIFIKLLLQG